ncbi:MAG: GNAT family N-acetyltransferase [Pseudomonadota bacterium]
MAETDTKPDFRERLRVEGATARCGTDRRQKSRWSKGARQGGRDRRLGSGMQFGPWRVDTLATASEIRDHRQVWLALEQECTDPYAAFQSYVWVENWARVFCARFPDLPQPRILMLYRDDLLVAILPMMISAHMGARTLTLFGEPHSQIANALVRAGHDVTDGLRLCLEQAALLTDADVLAFGPIPDTSPLMAAMDGAYLSPDPAEYLSLIGWPGMWQWEDYENSLTKNRRRDLHRKQRAAQRRGKLRYEIIEPDAPDFATHVRTALHWKRNWLKRKGMVSIGLAREGHDDFLASLPTANGAFHGELERLSCGGRTMAYNVNLVGRGERLCYLSTHDPHFKTVSPGMLLDQYSVRNAIEGGLVGRNYLGFPTGYKGLWSNGTVPLWRYRRAVTLRGTLWLKVWTDTLRPASKRVLMALRGLSKLPVVGPALGRFFAALAPTKA